MKPSAPVRIAIDAQHLLGDLNTSGSVYLGGMLRVWIAERQPVHFDLFVPSLPAKDAALAEAFAAPNVRLITPRKPAQPNAAYRNQVAWQQFIIPGLIRQSRPDVYFSPFHLTPQLPLGTRMVTTIHDLCFLSEPLFSMSHLVHRAQLISAGVRARVIICVSEFTRATLAEWWPRAGRKAVAIPNGVQARMMTKAEAVEILRPENLPVTPDNFFIWIGNPLQARKNVELLLKAFAAHHQNCPAHRFVMVVPPSARAAVLARPEASSLGPALVLRSGISDRVRDALYRCAAALVFPSTCEGFGFPVLEAMFQGCPPIAAAEGPAGEMAGDVVPLCPDFRTESFAGRMRAVVELSAGERAELAQALGQQAEKFSVERMAAATLAVLLEAARGDARAAG